MTKEEIIALTVKAVREYDEKQSKSRYDRRLRNTKLLLENYNLLKKHCENAIYDKQQVIECEDNAIDILDSLDKCESDTYIESIKTSTIRTKIILAHIGEMLDMYEVYCQRLKRKGDDRRHRVLKAAYLDEKEPEEIALIEGVDERTIFRDMKDAREKLSALIFGIDGLHNVS